jgi:hypothetical protein
MQLPYRVTHQAEICFGILVYMKLSFSTQSKLGNNLFVAAAEPTPTPTPTPGVLGMVKFLYKSSKKTRLNTLFFFFKVWLGVFSYHMLWSYWCTFSSSIKFQFKQ